MVQNGKSGMTRDDESPNLGTVDVCSFSVAKEQKDLSREFLAMNRDISSNWLFLHRLVIFQIA